MRRQAGACRSCRTLGNTNAAPRPLAVQRSQRCYPEWPGFANLRLPLGLVTEKLMNTYPILRPDGSMLAFEMTSSWVTFGPLFRILRSVQGVTHVRRNYFHDDRLSFLYFGEACVVNEPWGDNSRYWVGPREAETSSLDFAPINRAFEARENAFARLWSILRRTGSVA
jgi:hypothetical protein